MVAWILCSLLKNKKVVTIMLWNVTTVLVYSSVFLVSDTYVLDDWYRVILFLSIIILYFVLGLFADAFIGRYRLIQFSLWVQWATVIMSTFISAMLEYYDIAQWIQSLLVLTLFIFYVLGLSSFQVVSLQFGTDQLQWAPSDHFSAFVFWYVMIERLLAALIHWIFYLLSLSENKNITERIPLALNLLGALLISVALSIKSCFMSKWFTNESTMSNPGVKSSNPYHLIYRILKFAKDNKCPVQRSAFTYWENEIPSRIDLGKSKYGGPFTTEEVEDVRTFLHLFKLLLSLAGILVFSFFNQLLFGNTTSFKITATNASKSSDLLMSAVCRTATMGFLVLARALFIHFCNYYLSMLKRIGIGSVLTFTCALYILLINCLEYTTSIGERINIIAYLNLVIPMVLFEISYIALKVSLLEFIIAQSPQNMKGILIGIFYVIRYGIGGLLALIQRLLCTHLHSALSCNGIVSYAVVTVIILVSGIVFSIVACKYRLRERDEVVNVHIFAEEYYGTREDNSISYSDVDHDA